MAFLMPLGDIFFAAATSFLAGIFSASVGWSVWLVLGTGALVMLGVRMGARHLYLAEFLLCTFLVLTGVIYRHAARERTERGYALLAALPDKGAMITGLVADEPQPSARSALITLRALRPVAGEITFIAPKGSSYGYGDMLILNNVTLLPRTAGERPAVLSRAVRRVAEHRASRLREALINFKNAILGNFEEQLPLDDAALLGGITLGAKQNFDRSLKDAMAASGTTHLVAISGYNITIVVLAAEAVFRKFLGRRTVFWLTTLCVVLFVLMTGVQASAVRAGIMGFLALIARETGRPASMRNPIVLTAAIMALADPSVLAANVGFELSFMSLLGVVYLEPVLARVFNAADGGFLGWKESAVATTSAQLGVLPVIMHVFGRFSALGIVANVLLLGTVPFTMALGFALALVSFIVPWLAAAPALCARLMLEYQLAVIRFFGKVVLPLPAVFDSAFVMIAYYAALGYVAYRYRPSLGPSLEANER